MVIIEASPASPGAASEATTDFPAEHNLEPKKKYNLRDPGVVCALNRCRKSLYMRRNPDGAVYYTQGGWKCRVEDDARVDVVKDKGITTITVQGTNIELCYQDSELPETVRRANEAETAHQEISGEETGC
ncbi:hypothetical protein ACRE_074430 [Hapsidospora chrysogenum ATCC 11550]|uniref:Uncharacterized protein n=1 Tax=Hapsidospora chrysogenum (strain ATCC 11550 / CBS 779.69 / DSM 880 / IAM 14645 / JCM 23072 / IMI 49137) TaxID=857340 RepID=A0A086SXJ8_HAPC1|nr:hypothetical protein ACRE_074430 [Hapsidospora chrysogenum ATCC 11550]